MTGCEPTRELLAWYIEGSLAPAESVCVAEHLASCPACLRDLAEGLRVRSAVRAAVAAEPFAADAVWERVARQVVGRRVAQLDVGSFALGFRLGAWLSQRGSPVKADLRVLGRHVRLIDHKRGGGST
jgi:anti-sigma factor RsiW